MSGAVPLGATTRNELAAAWGLSPDAQFTPLGSGLINRTLLVTDDGRRRVLQCLNTQVFRDPAQVSTTAELFYVKPTSNPSPVKFPLALNRAFISGAAVGFSGSTTMP